MWTSWAIYRLEAKVWHSSIGRYEMSRGQDCRVYPNRWIEMFTQLQTRLLFHAGSIQAS